MCKYKVLKYRYHYEEEEYHKGAFLVLSCIYDIILEIINVEIVTFANDTDILAIGANEDEIFNVNCRKKKIFI